MGPRSRVAVSLLVLALTQTVVPIKATAPPSTKVAFDPVCGPSGGFGGPTVGIIFCNWNGGGVVNNPTAPTTFSIAVPYRITRIINYHFPYGPATGTISLKALTTKAGKKLFGPWKITASIGFQHTPNVIWTAHPNTVLPAGTYQVIDSSPATWSQDGGSGGQGFSEVISDPPPPSPLPTDIFTSYGQRGSNISGLREGPVANQLARLAAWHIAGQNAWPKTHYYPPIAGCPGGVVARIVPSDIGGTTNPKPKGGVYPGDNIFYEAGHLLAKNLGGSDEDLRNFVAQTVNANHGSFQVAENIVRSITGTGRSRGSSVLGFGVVYVVIPNYLALPPRSVKNLCIPDTFTILIGRTSVHVRPGQRDFYTEYKTVVMVKGVPTTVTDGAICGISMLSFPNTTTSSQDLVITPLIIPSITKDNNSLVNLDCLPRKP